MTLSWPQKQTPTAPLELPLTYWGVGNYLSPIREYAFLDVLVYSQHGCEPSWQWWLVTWLNLTRTTTDPNQDWSVSGSMVTQLNSKYITYTDLDEDRSNHATKESDPARTTCHHRLCLRDWNSKPDLIFSRKVAVTFHLIWKLETV